MADPDGQEGGRGSDDGGDGNSDGRDNGNGGGNGNGGRGGQGGGQGDNGQGDNDQGGGSQGNGQGDSQGSGGQGNGGQDNDQNGGDQSPSTVEKAVILLSTAFTVALFAFAVWQAVTVPVADAPQAHVIGQETTPTGEVIVTVELRNPQDIGLRSVTVEVGCTTPPSSVTWENVPADGRRVGHIVCPPGTENPQVSVASWVEV